MKTFEDLGYGELFLFARDGSRQLGESPMMKIEVATLHHDTELYTFQPAYLDLGRGHAWIAIEHERKLEVETHDLERLVWAKEVGR